MILIVAGWISIVCVILFSLLFIVTSLQEKRNRAAGIMALAASPFWIAGIVLLLVSPPSESAILTVWGGVSIIGAVVLLIPVGAVRGMRLDGKRDPIDERDAFFHRFYRLKPGMKEFDQFYHDNPELKEIDTKIRELPNIDEPGGFSYSSKTTPYFEAVFDVMERLFREETWEESIESRPKIEADAGEFTRRIKGFSRYAGADLVGITRLNQADVYTHIGRSPGPWGAAIRLDHPFAVVLAVEMDYDMVKCAPHHITTTESSLSYYQVGQVALILAHYIQKLGYRARPHVDGNYRVICPSLAVQAGLGELGRMGLVITPRFGPRARFAVVTTDLPLLPDKPIAFGVQQLCELCKKCAVNCPSGAIDKDGKKTVRGVVKWVSSQEKCYTYWRKAGSDCSVCLKVCPYSHPSSLVHNFIRTGIRKNPIFRRLALAGDDLFYGRRPSFTYRFPEWHEP